MLFEGCSLDFTVHDPGDYHFGPFRLDPVRRALRCDGKPVKLSPRLFDTLLLLVRNAGRVVEKDEILNAVWGGRIVEEGNLSQAISVLRKTLQAGCGEAYIVTAPGRGYRFAAPVELMISSGAASSRAAEEAPASEPPAPLSPRQHRAAGHRKWLLLAAVPLMLAGLLTIYLARPRQMAAFAPPAHSVAVLAFANLTGDPAQTYLSDGLSEEIIDSLARLPHIHVAARISAFTFRDKPATAADIGRALNVGAILEGSLRHEGNRLRIAARLIDTATGYELWSRTFDRDWVKDDMLGVQLDIATAIAGSLDLDVPGTTPGRLAAGLSHDGAAYDAYLRGLNQAQTRDQAHRSAAIAAFTEAAGDDPGFADAYAQRSNVLRKSVTAGTGRDPAADRRTLDAARADALHAIDLAPEDAAAHAALAELLMTQLDFQGFEAAISRARVLAPGNAQIETAYGFNEVMLGHFDTGLAALRYAVSLDPLRPGVYRNLGNGLAVARHWDEALQNLRRAAAMEAHQTHERDVLIAGVYLMQRNYTAAARICEGFDTRDDNECLAMAYHAMGRTADAQAQLARLQAKMGDSAAYLYADIFAIWGQHDMALTWLRKAVELRDTGLYEMKTDCYLDALRGDPAFQEILTGLRFPD